MTVVALHFDLPPLQAGTGILRLDETADWLAHLPMLNTAQTSRTLLDRLVQINRLSIADEVRLKILELLREPIHAMCLALITSYESLPLPLAGSAGMAAERVQILYTEMATGYKRLIVAASQHVNTTPAQRAQAALCIQRVVHALSRVLATRFALYAPVPAGLWADLHTLYRYAETEDITEVPIADALNRSVATSSVSHVYKQALLLEFTGPYHLPARMIEKIYRYLDAMAPLAQVPNAVPALRPACQFVINLAGDHAGAADIENAAITTKINYRFLTTASLARALHTQLTELKTGAVSALHGLKQEPSTSHGIEMLTQLLVAWGVHPKRHFARIARDHWPAMVCIGIEAACRHVNNGATFERSSMIVGPMPLWSRQVPNNDDATLTHAPADATSDPTWELLDESAGGFRLGCTSARSDVTHVGDVVSVRHKDRGGGPEIGLVRWVMHESKQSSRVGVQRLTPTAQVVGIYSATEPDGDFHVVLRLPAVAALKQPETLLTPRGLFQPKVAWVLDDSLCTHPIMATRLVNLTGWVEQFEFRVLDTAGQ